MAGGQRVQAIVRSFTARGCGVLASYMHTFLRGSRPAVRARLGAGLLSTTGLRQVFDGRSAVNDRKLQRKLACTCFDI
jgi:hypothetical protein